MQQPEDTSHHHHHSPIRDGGGQSSAPEKPAMRRRLTRSTAAISTLDGLKFIGKTSGSTAWSAVENKFKQLTKNTNGVLHRSHFGECIGMREDSKEFACALFDVLTRRGNIAGDSITKAQLRELWEQIDDQRFDSRLQIFLDMVDKDADGKITEDEVREVISFSASANKLSNIHKMAGEYARLLMEELDPSNLGYIKIENLQMLLLSPSSLAGGDGEGSDNDTLSEKLKPNKDHPLKKWYRNFNYFLVDNWKRIWVMALWIGAMAALFAYKYVQYKNRAAFDVMGHCVCVAKGAAETLKLNMALMLLPVCRNTLTWLRNKTRLGVAVPFDDNLNFHFAIAVAIAIGVGIHGISHLACDFPRLLNASPEKYKPMEPYFGDQPTTYWHFVKGWEGVTGILMVVLMAIAFTLASPWFRRRKEEKSSKTLTKILNKLTGFNAFWYSHHLFIIVYTLLIIHGIKLYLSHEWYKKTTWMYLAVPITLYAGERFVRSFRSRAEDVQILKASINPGNVLELQMSKPDGFTYRSGEYLFVKCPAVSPFEWHPFSITSAPGDNFLSVHIRIVGDWTGQLKKVFSEVRQQEPNEKTEGADGLQEENTPNYPRVLIDGPYGAPTQDYKDYDVVLLIGLGIGATPMISVVRDILNNIKAIDCEEKNALEEGRTGGPRTPHGTSTPSKQNEFKTRKAYFYWVTREQGSFDWFKGVMNEVAEMDRDGVIEMHNYCTSVYEEGDARSALIAMLQSINLAKHGVDIVSGTRVMSHFAKPIWKTVYGKIAHNHPKARVGVFYCGAPQPVQELRQHASDFSHTGSTTFEFHKENF